jgi:hypothetical protein
MYFITHKSINRQCTPYGASVAQSSEQGPFTSQFVGSILAVQTRVKESVNALPKVVGFLRFPPTGEVDRVG